jgi:type I restriction enzyme S subunit
MSDAMKSSGIDWIGNIPADWQLCKLRFATVVRTESGNYTQGDTFIGLENVESTSSKLIETDTKYENCVYDVFCKGDVLFSKLRPYLEKAFIAKFDGFCTGEFVVFKSFVGDKRFLLRFLLSHGFIKTVDASTYGAKMPRASWEYIKNLFILTPCEGEQRAIADFLDDHCGQIDSVVADMERQIELLRKYKRALITETVTKGLDKSAPMKSSGIDWIGDVPAHWDIDKVRYLTSEICSGTTPSKDNLAYWEGDIPWISSMEVKSDVIGDTSLHISIAGVNSCATKLLPVGTVVMVVRSGILRHTLPVALTGIPATINQDLKAFTFKPKMLPPYFKYFIQGHNDSLLMVLTKDKSTVENIDYNLLLSCPVTVPPTEEQHSIIRYLDEKCSIVDAILTEKQRSVDTMKQYRKSLIYEYVTGKKRIAQ